MSDILVVAFVVSCGHQLLNCEEIVTRNHEFSDISECRARIVELILEEQQLNEATRKIMGHCHYLLDSQHTPDRMVPEQIANAQKHPYKAFQKSNLDKGKLRSKRTLPRGQEDPSERSNGRNTHQSKHHAHMEGLLTAIVTWLSVNFKLPSNYDHPTVELLPAADITQFRKRAGNLRNGHEVIAFYDDTKKTIYLTEGWMGKTPAELSILVHEMVHHLQNVADFEYECPALREKTAYAVQDAWLSLFGQSLRTEFRLDRLTLKLRTECIPH